MSAPRAAPEPASARRPRSVPAILLVAMLALVAGCTASGQWLETPAAPVGPPAAVVFVADGAGNFQAASMHLRDVVACDRLPIDVRTFEWSHGYGRIVADQ